MGDVAELVQKDTESPSRETAASQTALAPGLDLDPHAEGTFQGSPRESPDVTVRSLLLGRSKAQVLQRAQRLYGNRASQQIVMRARALQRQCHCGGSCAKCRGEEERRQVQRKQVQRKSDGESSREFEGIPATYGEALSPGTRQPLEAHFGADLSEVRVHTGGEAAESASSLDALAYTSGRDIYFASGMYEPSSTDGRRLLAHEVAHVVQQSAGKEPSLAMKSAHGVKIGAPDDVLETEADRNAQEFVSGGSSDPAEEQRKHRESAGVVQRFIQRDSDPATPAPPAAPVFSATPGPPTPEPVAPQHKDMKIATWEGSWDSSVKTTWMLGEIEIDHYMDPFGLPVGAIPASITGAGWTPGHYPSEAAAIAAINAGGTAGAVFVEAGQYVAYHVLGKGHWYEFTLDNLRWFDNKPWTALHFDTFATAIVTDDGATLHPENYKSKSDAAATVADQGLMPGDQDPFAGYQQAFGDPNKPGAIQLVFYPAMKANALSVLSKGRVQAQREMERRFSSGVIPPNERKVIKGTAEYLAGIDQEMADIPKDLPYTPGELADFQVRQERFHALESRRRVVLARYPMLARINPREFVKLSESQQDLQLGGEAAKILEDIDKTRDNVIDGSLNLWKIHPLLDSTIAGLGITDPEARKHVYELAAANESSVEETILKVFGVVFGLASIPVSGPAGLALAAGALGLGVADAIRETNQYFVEQAASNTALDPAMSLLPPDEAKSWGWLVLAWVGVIGDAVQVVHAVKEVIAAGESIEAGIKLIAKGDTELASRLRAAAAVDTGEIISEASKAGLANRLGTSIEIDATLGKEIRVVYSVDSRGRIVVEGIHCGTEAKVGEILAHAPVVKMLRRYDGLIGRFREIFDRLMSFGGFAPRLGVNPFPVGSQAFESYLELQKLDTIIELRRAELGLSIGTESEPILRRDVEFLESELARHQGVVDQLTLEQGLGYVARAEEQTAKAVKEGMPALAGDPLISDASKYYYRVNPTSPPPYILTRFANSEVPARTLVPNGAGGWKIAEGALSRLEEASAMVNGWPKKIQDAYHALESARSGAGVFRVVPLQGVATTGKTIRELIEVGQQDRLYKILLTAFEKEPDAAAKATKAMNALLDHDITLVRGTDQLRAYNYRLAFEKATGAEASGDLHHLIPLYLGGDSTRLIDMAPELHDALHDLIDAIRLEKGATLAPSSVQAAKAFNFSEGAAVLGSDGTVQLARLNPDGTFTLVP